MSAHRITACQSCGAGGLHTILKLGFLPLVNDAVPAGSQNVSPFYPANLLRCQKCSLVQLGCVVNSRELFPPSYPYRSQTTKLLRDDFAALAEAAQSRFGLKPPGFVIDIGGNDGSLLTPFVESGFHVLNVEPTDAAVDSNARGVEAIKEYFSSNLVGSIGEHRAALITATNVLAHVEDVHDFLSGVVRLLAPGGLFVSESHYWPELVRRRQWDTIYHEHLRYYSIESLRRLLKAHGLGIVEVERIPTHGGSIRIWAKLGEGDADLSKLLKQELMWTSAEAVDEFCEEVSQGAVALNKLLTMIHRTGKTVFGIGAPSRATTLVNIAGLHTELLSKVVEVKGSAKLGLYVPGTEIPIVEEGALYQEQPDFALLLSWHISDELIPKLRQKGFRGKFITPLPQPGVLEGR